jgi:hypothetical protein
MNQDKGKQGQSGGSPNPDANRSGSRNQGFDKREMGEKERMSKQREDLDEDVLKSGASADSPQEDEMDDQASVNEDDQRRRSA